MPNTLTIGFGAALVALAAAPLAVAQTAPAPAQDAISAPAQKTIGAPQYGMIPSLAVVNSRGATLQGNALTMTGVSPNSIVFADRPVRAAGHVLTKDFLKDWDEGSGGTFAGDPPNATISVLSADGASVEDAVVVLKAPKLEGDKLTFDVSVLEGGLSKATGPASLFIDWFRAGYGGATHVGWGGATHVGWGGATHVGYGGYAHVGGAWGGAWHGAWYAHPAYGAGAALAAGAVVGAAAAEAHPYYYPPACGYYPYPPCY